MGYIIHFIGIIMIVRASTTTKVTDNMALMPVGRAGQTFCSGVVTIREDHAVFVRVNNSGIKDKTGWTDTRSCASEPCTVFRVADGSDIAIDSGFTSAGGIVRDDTSCLVPGIHEVNRRVTVDLINNPAMATVAAMKLPDGTLKGRVLRNEMVETTLAVTPPPGTPAHEITITAKPRGGGSVRTLIVREGTEITIMNVPLGQETMPIGMTHIAVAPKNAHFFLYNSLLDTELCKMPPTIRVNCSANNRPINLHTSTDFACSNTGCCKP